ncbi:MAG: hypothetical protein V4576_02140 [Patescibacteria group bacterium]
MKLHDSESAASTAPVANSPAEPRTVYSIPIVLFWDPSCCVDRTSFEKLTRKFNDIAILTLRANTNDEITDIIVPDHDAVIVLACSPISNERIRTFSQGRNIIVLCTTVDTHAKGPGPHWKHTKKHLVQIPEKYNLEKLLQQAIEETRPDLLIQT